MPNKDTTGDVVHQLHPYAPERNSCGQLQQAGLGLSMRIIMCTRRGGISGGWLSQTGDKVEEDALEEEEGEDAVEEEAEGLRSGTSGSI